MGPGSVNQLVLFVFLLYSSSSSPFLHPLFTLLLCSHTMILLTTKLGVGMHPGSPSLSHKHAHIHKARVGSVPKDSLTFLFHDDRDENCTKTSLGKFTETPADRTQLFATISAVLNLEVVKDGHPPYPRTLPLWEKGAFIYLCSMTVPHLTTMGNKCILISSSRFLRFIFKT